MLTLMGWICVLCCPFPSFSQYLESFSTPNKGYLTGFVNDFTGVGWTISPWANQPPAEFGRDTDDYFQTTASGKLESIDLDQEVCWESPSLNVIATGTIAFTADIEWNGYDGLQTSPLEYINVEYQINSGVWVRHPNILGTDGDMDYTVRYIIAGSFSSSATTNFPSIAVTAGNTIKVRVCISNNANAELVTIDNVSVSGVTTGCAAPLLSAVVTQVGCSNPNSGAIDLSVSAGNPPYTYDWSNDGPETPDNDPQDLTGLAVGMYTVTVTDAASCSATLTVNVTNAPAIALSTQILNTNCSGTMDGEIDLIVSGGVPGYTYDWSNDGPETPDNDPQDLIGIGTGTYTVTVTDASGCTAMMSAVVGTLPVTAYLEQFNIDNKGYLPNFVDDFSAVNWTMTSWPAEPSVEFGRDNNDFFRTSSGVLRGEDFDQEVCWISPLIGMNTATEFSVDLAWTGFDNQEDEYINVKYSIDGGSYVTVPNMVGGGSGTIQYASGSENNGTMTITKTGLSGNTIQIQVCGDFNANAESMTIDNVSVPGSSTYCPAPDIDLSTTNVTCTGGNNGSIQVTASGGIPGYQVSWSGPSVGNPVGTEIAVSGGMYNIPMLMEGTYVVTVTGANGLTSTSSAMITAINPPGNAAFSYTRSGYCQTGMDPLPVIHGNTGGTFSGPAQVVITLTTGQIDVSASTVGGPYLITYTTGEPCPAMATFSIYIVNCQPGAMLNDMLITDNGVSTKADPGDRIRMTAAIHNGQVADYEGVQLMLTNDPRTTFVANSFKTTPIAVNDSYSTPLNILLNVMVVSGLLQNDFDDNKSALTVTAFSTMSTQGGTVSVSTDGSFTYNPPSGFTGNDTFTYTVTDSDFQTNSATVFIQVL